MARLKIRDSDICWRCDRSRGTLIHMLYECQMTWNLWENVIIFLNNVFRTELIQSPALCILGILTEGVDLSAQQTLWCRLALSTSCRTVLSLLLITVQ
uniref:Reverse transcriptase zinc-binding domain-containing protein n=1 Tax=Sparus aurata TaxID=8175 RepID=A0A671VMM1_SPAAU